MIYFFYLMKITVLTLRSTHTSFIEFIACVHQHSYQSILWPLPASSQFASTQRMLCLGHYATYVYRYSLKRFFDLFIFYFLSYKNDKILDSFCNLSIFVFIFISVLVSKDFWQGDFPQFWLSKGVCDQFMGSWAFLIAFYLHLIILLFQG